MHGAIEYFKTTYDFEYRYDGEGGQEVVIQYTGGVINAWDWPPAGMPLNWRAQIGGELAKAFAWFFDWAVKRYEHKPDDPPPDELPTTVVMMIRDYLVHFILAPCWAAKYKASGRDNWPLVELTRDVFKIETGIDVIVWARRCIHLLQTSPL